MKIKEKIQLVKQLYRNRYASKWTYSPQSLDDTQKAWLRELQAKGAVMIPNFFTPEQCDEVKSVIDQQLAHFQANKEEILKIKGDKFGRELPSGITVWTDKEESDFRIFNAEKLNDTIHWYNQTNKHTAVGTEYLKANLEVRSTMCNRVTFKPANLGSGGGWHRDMTYKRGFKAMVYLTDVDAQSGPFQFIPRSADLNYHFAHLLKVDQYQFSHEEVLGFVGGNENQIVSCIAPKGTLLLFETNMIHRGKPLDEGKIRYAMTNYYNF